MKKNSTAATLASLACTFALALSAGLVSTDAQAGREVKNNTKSSVNKNVNNNSNRNVNVNNNSNKNTNVNVNSNKHVDVNVDVDRGRDYHPIGTAVRVGTTVALTAAVIGALTPTLPPTGCYPVQIGNVLYQQCGSTWYQPQYSGSSVQYLVVVPPR